MRRISHANKIHKRAWLAIFQPEPTTPNMSQLAGQTNIAPNIVGVRFVEMLLSLSRDVKYIKIGLNWVDVFVEDLLKYCSFQSEGKHPKMWGHLLCYFNSKGAWPSLYFTCNANRNFNRSLNIRTLGWVVQSLIKLRCSVYIVCPAVSSKL